MASYYNPVDDPEGCRACPYCSMMIRVKRWQYHLMKCRKNHPEKRLDVCPFNASHIIPSAELRHHMATCKDRGMIEKDLLHQQERHRQRVGGDTSVPEYVDQWVEPTEDWESEANAPAFGVPDEYLDQIQHRKTVPAPEPMRVPKQLPEVLRRQQQAKSNTTAPLNAMVAQQQYNEELLQQLARGRGRSINAAPPAVGAMNGGTSIGRGALSQMNGHIGRGRQATLAHQATPNRTANHTPNPYSSAVSTPAMGVGRGGIGRGVAVRPGGTTSAGSITPSSSSSSLSSQDIPPPGARRVNDPAFSLCGSSSSSSSPVTSARNSPARVIPPQPAQNGAPQNGHTPQFVVPKVPIAGTDDSLEIESSRDKLKELRKTRKKLKAIEALELKQQEGQRLTDEEVEKLGKKADLEQYLSSLTL